MTGWQKVAGFVLAAAVAFAVAIGIGRAVGPIDGGDEEHGHDDRIAVTPAEPAESGRTEFALDLARDVHEAGRQRLAFTIRDGEGEPVTSYDVQHEKLLHLVVVRRDLGGYRHVHPTLDETTGEWTTPLDLDAGSWRVYADFTPTGGEASLAEADLSVAGDFAPTELGPDNDTAKVDGFEVHLAREDDEITLHVQRDGRDVTDLEPYLGAYGHLVAIRAEDLTYLHVHPQEGEPGPEVAFHAGLDEPGRYRLFFEFQHGGVVHRAELTVTVGEPGQGQSASDQSASDQSASDQSASDRPDDDHGGHGGDEQKEESGGHDH